jgi:hypothetical protein
MEWCPVIDSVHVDGRSMLLLELKYIGPLGFDCAQQNGNTCIVIRGS